MQVATRGDLQPEHRLSVSQEKQTHIRALRFVSLTRRQENEEGGGAKTEASVLFGTRTGLH